MPARLNLFRYCRLLLGVLSAGAWPLAVGYLALRIFGRAGRRAPDPPMATADSPDH